MATGQAEPTWEELLGLKNWDGLLNPLNLKLRQLLRRCGDFCQKGSDYDVVSFLYATACVSVPEALLIHSRSRESWDRESNWMGYVAVTTDQVSRALGRREIYVAWRGTIQDYKWINVLGADQGSAKPLLRSNDNNKDDDEVQVMRGWLTIYISNNSNSPFVKTSARVQLITIIKQLTNKYKDEKLSVVIAGHSLGASLAVLSAFDFAEHEAVTKDTLVTAFVFGCPQVGNKEFRERVESHRNLKILHTRNTIDFITRYPGPLLGYVDIGTELVIDSRKSPYLNETLLPGDWHNLQGMLHVVDGWNGEEGEFELKVKRSLALVNKSSGFLKEDYLVPSSWWAEKNKGRCSTKVAGTGSWLLLTTRICLCLSFDVLDFYSSWAPILEGGFSFKAMRALNDSNSSMVYLYFRM
ncbi:Fungal lipase-like domain containing protein [Parasponia andersonii]|uniref:Phospholipase A1 n=1 Tax=Parasponia andersonii TaxID=3476 RepID=A0A2P5A4M3_PARAD|nr:Fungal lipase-like domain containing protein [Parasponia andersonii]